MQASCGPVGSGLRGWEGGCGFGGSGLAATVAMCAVNYAPLRPSASCPSFPHEYVKSFTKDNARADHEGRVKHRATWHVVCLMSQASSFPNGQQALAGVYPRFTSHRALFLTRRPPWARAASRRRRWAPWRTPGPSGSGSCSISVVDGSASKFKVPERTGMHRVGLGTAVWGVFMGMGRRSTKLLPAERRSLG